MKVVKRIFLSSGESIPNPKNKPAKVAIAIITKRAVNNPKKYSLHSRILIAFTGHLTSSLLLESSCNDEIIFT